VPCWRASAAGWIPGPPGRPGMRIAPDPPWRSSGGRKGRTGARGGNRETRAAEGFGDPPAPLAGFQVRKARRRLRVCRAAPRALSTVIRGGAASTSPVIATAESAMVCGFPGHWCGGSRVLSFAVPDWSPLLLVVSRAGVFLTSAPSSGGEVRNTEAARCELVCAGSRGDRDGTAARSARTRGRCAAPSVCEVCTGCARWCWACQRGLM